MSARTHPDFVAVREELPRILEIVEGPGASVAFPSQTAYLRADEPAAATKKGKPSQ